MYLSEISIENFRQFGAGDNRCIVPFRPGVTALVGENDAGKSAIIDAIRFVLLTRDSEYASVQHEDFHNASDGEPSNVITLTCRIAALSTAEQGAFAEFLSFEHDPAGQERAVLYIQWQAKKVTSAPTARRWVDITVTCGRDGRGPTLDSAARQLLSAAYLKPLRDASRELSAGRRSRLSQVLGNMESIKNGKRFSDTQPPSTATEAMDLSLVGISHYTKHLVNNHEGIVEARETLNQNYLSRMQLSGNSAIGTISVSEGGKDDAVLRQLLERLELVLQDGPGLPARGPYGLGSNNLLFMACELLLLGSEWGLGSNGDGLSAKPCSGAR
ncbi:AAA family ATPase [Arthrobacter sp. UCD-GKA]|uniref:AAA family ATPase n=1 Tax=Arthrobacter sp. UCD-GKA TaxID=1913576 RepID=UPI0009F2C432|nr:AAA family ATPase [Arthrobacter sp. UCD-GKA]